jgi:hypothetical protein
MLNCKKLNLLISVLCVITLFSVSTLAQQEKLLTSNKKKSYIKEASKLLIDNYVFQDVALKIEKHLKSQLAKGVFNKFTDLQGFADALTMEMQSISKDKHMRCRVKGATSGLGVPSKPEIEIKELMEEKSFGFARAGKLEDKIGYLEIFNFPPVQNVKKSADEAMEYIADSKALIIDLRRNGGGNPDLIQYICSYFFEKPTHINSLYFRPSGQTTDFITFEKVDGKKMSGIPIFVLTSSYTFSGGEEFAYNIQTQKRGLLIGQVTGGGANPGWVFPIGDDLGVFIPTGRAINPITKTNWEGIGVIPDIKTDAAKAFELALDKAKQSVEGK